MWIQNGNRTLDSESATVLMNPIPTQIYTIPTPNPIPLHMIPNPESNSDSSFDSGFGIAPGLLGDGMLRPSLDHWTLRLNHDELMSAQVIHLHYIDIVCYNRPCLTRMNIRITTGNLRFEESR